jgi:hypothetical protein
MIDADWHVRDCLAGFEKCAERKSNLLFEINLALMVDKGGGFPRCTPCSKLGVRPSPSRMPSIFITSSTSRSK